MYSRVINKKQIGEVNMTQATLEKDTQKVFFTGEENKYRKRLSFFTGEFSALRAPQLRLGSEHVIVLDSYAPPAQLRELLFIMRGASKGKFNKNTIIVTNNMDVINFVNNYLVNIQKGIDLLKGTTSTVRSDKLEITMTECPEIYKTVELDFVEGEGFTPNWYSEYVGMLLDLNTGKGIDKYVGK